MNTTFHCFLKYRFIFFFTKKESKENVVYNTFAIFPNQNNKAPINSAIHQCTECNIDSLCEPMIISPKTDAKKQESLWTFKCSKYIKCQKGNVLITNDQYIDLHKQIPTFKRISKGQEEEEEEKEEKNMEISSYEIDGVESEEKCILNTPFSFHSCTHENATEIAIDIAIRILSGQTINGDRSRICNQKEIKMHNSVYYNLFKKDCQKQHKEDNFTRSNSHTFYDYEKTFIFPEGTFFLSENTNKIIEPINHYFILTKKGGKLVMNIYKSDEIEEGMECKFKSQKFTPVLINCKNLQKKKILIGNYEMPFHSTAEAKKIPKKITTIVSKMGKYLSKQNLLSFINISKIQYKWGSDEYFDKDGVLIDQNRKKRKSKTLAPKKALVPSNDKNKKKKEAPIEKKSQISPFLNSIPSREPNPPIVQPLISTYPDLLINNKIESNETMTIEEIEKNLFDFLSSKKMENIEKILYIKDLFRRLQLILNCSIEQLLN